MKKIIVYSVIAVCLVMMYYYPQVMLNPGEISSSHQKTAHECMACHAPFRGIANDKCITCHKLSSIDMDSGTVGDTAHVRIRFHEKLTDASCSDCHTEHKGNLPNASFNHRILSEELATQCNSCHNTPDNKLHRSLSTACNACHTDKGWKAEVVFNHDMIQDSDKTNCLKCHNQPSGELHRKLSTDCGVCHAKTGWKEPLSFNHNAIIGADKTNCASCHKVPADALHTGLTGNCSTCHAMDHWSPSTFNHTSYFSLDENHNAKCSTCHPNNNFKAYSCYGCHEHSESKVIREHTEEGITNFTNCTSCHRSGNEHDIIQNGNSNRKADKKEVEDVKKYIKKEHGHDDD